MRVAFDRLRAAAGLEPIAPAHKIPSILKLARPDLSLIRCIDQGLFQNFDAGCNILFTPSANIHEECKGSSQLLSVARKSLMIRSGYVGVHVVVVKVEVFGKQPCRVAAEGGLLLLEVNLGDHQSGVLSVLVVFER